MASDGHAEKMARSLALFKTDVRAILIETCVRCHGGEKTQSGFDLTTREGLLAGGESGVSVIAGNPKESPLLSYLTHREELHMPPDRPPLSRETVATIARWIELGAAYDRPLIDRAGKQEGPMRVTDADRAHWAYAPLRTDFPEGATIDRFVRDKQREYEVTIAPEASRSTLIRRLYFDLTGLPPEPEATRAFLADGSPGAYEKLVDQLLASPHFGERWARHWLDVARFAESHGFEHDYERKHAFHFRDLVIRAFNQDMPYDRFVRWQLAGDELAPDDPLAMMATGFLGAGVHPTQITISEAERVRYDALDDMLATTGSAMLATTVGCARCHDHKYDPIPTRDYYRMLSTFKATVRTEVSLDLALLNKEAAAGLARRHARLRAELAEYETKQLPIAFNRWSASRRPESIAGGVPDSLIQLPDYLKVAGDEAPRVQLEGHQPMTSPDPAQTAAEREILALLQETPDPGREAAILEHFKLLDPAYRKIAAEVAAVESERKGYIQKVMICSEGEHIKPMRLHTSSGTIPDFYKECHLLNHGDTAQKAGVAEPGFLQVLTRAGEARWKGPPREGRTPGHRAALGRWITDVDHGAGHLLARVIVNRVWQHYFGRGLVATPNDFGSRGERPTHPELLDWLATELIRNGWRLKPIHKLVLMSQAYRVGELSSARNQEIDPENRLLWRRPPRRLEAEAIRDSALAVGGMLDQTLYGPGTLDETTCRRSLYFTIRRGRLVPVMQTFDWPDTLTSLGHRAVTTTPSQALVFLNHPLFRRAAEGFAARIMGEADPVGEAYMIAYARPSSDAERTLGTAFIRRQTQSHNGAVGRALTDFCAALMSANEFIYVD